jgi:hypothetical protein
MNKIKLRHRIRIMIRIWIRKRANFRMKMMNSSIKYQKRRKSMNKIKMKKIWSSKIVRAFRINRMSNKIWYKSKGTSNIQIKNISNTWISKTLISISKTCGISSSNNPFKNPNLINKMFKPKNSQNPLNKKSKRHLKINNIPINSNKSALVCLAT